MDQAPLPDVSQLYDRIFRDDPLLLKEENHTVFGDQILRNLLVERAIASSDPTDVTLGNGPSEKEFRALPRPSTRALNQTLRDAYFNSRRDREQIDDKDVFEDLQQVTMVAHGEKTQDRHSSLIVDHEDARTALSTTDSPLEARLTIAAVGYRVTISRLAERSLLNEELRPRVATKLKKSLTAYPENKTVEKLRRTTLRDKALHAGWFDTIRRHIELALGRGSHFVVLPEFCLPPDVAKPPATIANAIRKIANRFRHEFFLFSGSRHEGSYNRGFIVSREARKSLTKNWWHYKMASARGLGENIMGPQNWKLPSYNFTLAPKKFEKALHCRVCVAICYDIFDPTTFINYIVQCVEADKSVRETIILVPSFNPSKEFVHALRDLSFIAGCPVVYVNGLHGDAKLFLYGFAISDLVDIEARSETPDTAIPPLPNFDEYFRACEKLLEAKINECAAEVRAMQAAAKKITDRQTKTRILQLCSVTYAREDMLRHRAASLKSLARDLDRYRNNGALKHLITKQGCAKCAENTHNHGDYCANDVLYYNIDPGLMLAIKDFRNLYFEQDSFLPLPFRRSEKDKIFTRITDKKAARSEKMNRKRVNR